MRAIPSNPPAFPEEEISGLSCPECYGVLNVSTEGDGRVLRFRCRIGHLYSSDEVVVGKERSVEDHLWAAVTALTELAAMLHEIVASGRDANRAETFTTRARRATEQAAALRSVLDQSDPIVLGSAPNTAPGS